MTLQTLLAKPSRLVAGLMSGTSLDGIDVTLARLTGTGATMQIEVLHTYSEPYPERLRAVLLRNSLPDQPASVREICQLNAYLSHLYAQAVETAVQQAGLRLADLDLIGSHGQTIHHVPFAEEIAGEKMVSTLQIGDGSVLANRLGVATVCDFRTADMAVEGQGAPLVPYLDYVMFTHPTETRMLLNIGGIGNFTLLPAGGLPADVLAFDTGPGNMVINSLMQHFFDKAWDPEGRYAAQGQVSAPLLAQLLADPYYDTPPPKSTGREVYHESFVQRLIAENGHLSAYDLLATATMLTAASIHLNYVRFIAPKRPIEVLIASGGGIYNQTLMRFLAEQFSPIPVRTTQDYGLDPDGKEALCFAVLAHEYLNGTPTNMLTVTGASRPALLGKLCLPV